MRLITGQNLETLFKGKYLLLDNDFLGKLFEDEEFLKDFQALIVGSNLLLDPLTIFEFLRDVFVFKQRQLKENFVDSELFTAIINHQDSFKKVQSNALLLSKIYAHNNKAKGVSTIDLMLAARMLVLPANCLLITGNKKDYPSCIFDIETVLNVENITNESIKSYGVLTLNRNKLEEKYRLLAETSK